MFIKIIEDLAAQLYMYACSILHVPDYNLAHIYL